MDKRGKRIVYLSQCILNQNLRFPGIALESGAFSELLIPLIKNGIGIESIPCLERIGWGGVQRSTFFKYLPTISKNINSFKFPIIKFFIRSWLKKYSKICKKEAKKIVLQMLDYQNSGYKILGIITTNDSPTCGYTQTINILKILPEFEELKMNDKFKNPTLEEMKKLIPNLCEYGTGYLMTEIDKLLKKKSLNIEITGFNIWDDLDSEIKRILNKFNLGG